MAAKSGQDEVLNQFTKREMKRFVNGVISSCQAQVSLIEEVAGHNGLSETQLANKARKHISARLRDISFGQDGYPFIMDSQGTLRMHPKSSLVGQNVLHDLNVDPFRQILSQRSEGEVKYLSYSFEGRNKFVAYSYVPKWDWIICASAYWADMTHKAVQLAKESFQDSLQGVFTAAVMKTDQGKQPVLNKLRFVNPQGQAMAYVRQGSQARGGNIDPETEWFQQALQAPAGSTINAGLIVSEETQEVEMVMAAPVYDDTTLQAVAVVNMDWSLVWALLSEFASGRSEYVYVLNDEGFLVSHPKYTLQDRVNLSDAKYGQLSQIVREKWLTGEEGWVHYQFEGVKKYSAFTPISLGRFSYTVVANSPVEAFMASAHKIQAKAANRMSSMTWSIVIGASIFALLGLLVAWYFGRRIANPIQTIIDGLHSSSREVSAASNQLSTSSQSLAEGSSEQASSLEETSSSLEEMASQTKQNADNATQAEQAMEQENKEVEGGVQAMQQMRQAIDDIKGAAEETSKIIKTIDDIAFQTNLLALNAAVEAARAGEAGKGFAVVAEEVRNLAQRSAEAAQNTSQLIEKSQARAENGVAVVEDVSQRLHHIQENTEKVDSLIKEIAAASKEQSQGIEQVNTAVAEMDKVVQQNASDSEESASAAEELSSQAEALDRMVLELTAIVGATASRNGDTPRIQDMSSGTREKLETRQEKPGAQNQGRDTGKLGRTQSTKSTQASSSASGRSNPTPRHNRTSQSGEELLPLDDRDLSDF